MKLSVILVCYDMQRELPRTLYSLSRDYQNDTAELDYEVLLVDNGSPARPDEALWQDCDVPVRLLCMDGSSPSPAAAINRALAEARGEIICLMIDAAHILTPGVFDHALRCYRAFARAVVAVRYFYLGGDEQTVSVPQGYSKEEEDALLEKIAWPREGYRLFDVGTPLRHGAPLTQWLNRIGETNCLFLPRDLFIELGGADVRFDLPGGGFLNLDIYRRAVEADGVTPVQLIGEGSFHQLHGGITTNQVGERRELLQKRYREQYRAIRGEDDIVAQVDLHHFGWMHAQAKSVTARERRMLRQRKAAQERNHS